MVDILYVFSKDFLCDMLYIIYNKYILYWHKINYVYTIITTYCFFMLKWYDYIYC